MASDDRRLEARRFLVRGLVQSVGFRPFVVRLAAREGVTGWVRNEGGVVTILAEAHAASLDRFEAGLAAEAPPLAQVEGVSVDRIEPSGAAGFEVLGSTSGSSTGAPVLPPDVATCRSCLRELFDPGDRRFRYPFVNCTDCGPRFTIVESLPYDRVRTSMRGFPLCPECRREYEDPLDRRFHAEPVACPACGPTLRLTDAAGSAIDGDPIERTAALLLDGGIVAVKALGGFQLACDATAEPVVARLRSRKRRPDKPFAVMVASIEEARRWTEPTETEERLLGSWRAPIVLVADRGRLAPSVAPGHRRQGLMLPSTPLHHLLTRAAGVPLVMTSGNLSEEPIARSDDEGRALATAGIAEAVLGHDRAIVARYDDSVAQVVRGASMLLRRARGTAPAPIDLPFEVPPMLAVGAELHATFCLAAGHRAYVSPHVGDLDDDRALAAYAEALERARRLFGIDPELVAHDLHPDFLSTRLAEETGLPRVAVQHHHAHAAAVAVERGLEGPVLAVAFDGFGLGADGSGWGGELLLLADGVSTRVGHLRAVRQPGGDAAVRDPVRMALAHAFDAGLGEEALTLLGRHAPDAEAIAVLDAQLAGAVTSPWTTSAGRLFDAVAALSGVARRSTYEGAPAILLEQVADPAGTRNAIGYPLPFEPNEEPLVLDTRAFVAAVVRDLRAGVPAGEVAERAHAGIAEGVGAAVGVLAARHSVRDVVLAGGVFANVLLAEGLAARLERRRLSVHLPAEVPPGDGGISLGQVAVAAAGATAPR
jgi:hydrogenase maturation protein HypF